MAGLNMDSIMKKAEACMNTKEMRDRVAKLKDDIISGRIENVDSTTSSGGTIMNAYDAAYKYIDVLSNAIASSGLSDHATRVLISGIRCLKPEKIQDGLYQVEIVFDDDGFGMMRPSLDEATYGYINSLAALLNNGVDHVMHPVHGVWHDREVWSRTVIPGAGFMEKSRINFLTEYASKYNVKEVYLDGKYYQ